LPVLAGLLLLAQAAKAEPALTLLFTGNSYGELRPCPS
jgi:hypothetical protein